MPLPTSLRLEFKHAFVCSEDHIGRICSVLRKRIADNITIEAALSDGTKRGFLNEKELFMFNNPSSRRISELTVSAETNQYPNSNASVSFDRRFFLEGITVTGRADDEIIVVIRQELSEVVRSARPLYSPLACYHIVAALALGLMITAAVIVYAVHVLHLEGAHAPKGADQSGTVWTFVGLLVGTLISAPWLCWTGIRTLFPYGVFCIGDEKVDSQRRESLRNIVGGGILLSLSIGLIANYLSR